MLSRQKYAESAKKLKIKLSRQKLWWVGKEYAESAKKMKIMLSR